MSTRATSSSCFRSARSAAPTLELSYGASMLGGHPKLHEAAEKIVTAVRSIVPPSGVAIAPTAPAMRVRPHRRCGRSHRRRCRVRSGKSLSRFARHASCQKCRSVSACTLTAIVTGCSSRVAPRTSYRPRSASSTRTRTSSRRVSAFRSRPATRDTRLPSSSNGPGVAWVVVGIPNDVVAAIDAGKPSPYGFQAKVDDEWLSLDLVDTGCRLGRTHAKSAAS